MVRRGERGKGQVWSMDLVIGVIVFLVAVGLLLFLTGNQAKNDKTRLQVESRLLADTLTSDQDFSIVKQGAVSEEKLQEIVKTGSTDYGLLKDKLGMRDDFCIILMDEQQNLILIGNGTENRAGIGNDRLIINLTELGTSVPCGDLYT